MKFKQYLERNLNPVQKQVEKELEITLGEIEIRDKKHFLDDILETDPEIEPSEKESMKKRLLDRNRGKLDFAGGFHRIFPNRIYYDSNCITFPGYEDAIYFRHLAHELSHASHYNIVGKDDYKSVSSGFAEGFATYLSEKLIKDKFGIDLPGETSERLLLREEFKYDLKKSKVDSPDKLKNFLKNNFNFSE